MAPCQGAGRQPGWPIRSRLVRRKDSRIPLLGHEWRDNHVRKCHGRLFFIGLADSVVPDHPRRGGAPGQAPPAPGQAPPIKQNQETSWKSRFSASPSEVGTGNSVITRKVKKLLRILFWRLKCAAIRVDVPSELFNGVNEHLRQSGSISGMVEGFRVG